MNVPFSGDALLISKPQNIRYICGLQGFSETEIEIVLLLTHNKIFLFVSSLYQELANTIAATPQNKSKNITVFILDQTHTLYTFLKTLTDSENVKTICIEETHLPHATVEKLKSAQPHIRFIGTDGIIEHLRQIKTADEIKTIAKAAKITDDCFTFVQKNLKITQSENEIAWMIESYIRTHGGSLAFDPIVAFNEHSSQPHFRPGETKLSNQSIILLDFGAQVDGYMSDMTRMVFVGTPKPAWINAYTTVLTAQKKALGFLESFSSSQHIRAKTVDQQARLYIEKKGYPTYPHSLGHALGLQIHESPNLSPASDALLAPHMTLTIEPGIYLPGAFGIRIEDLIVLKKQGFENLTTSPKDLPVVQK